MATRINDFTVQILQAFISDFRTNDELFMNLSQNFIKFIVKLIKFIVKIIELTNEIIIKMYKKP